MNRQMLKGIHSFKREECKGEEGVTEEQAKQKEKVISRKPRKRAL